MARAILAVVVGFVLWSVLWVAAGLAVSAVWPDAVDESEGVQAVLPLATILAISVVISLASGALAARIAPARPTQAAAWLAGVLLAVGLMVEIAAWDLYPVWYHVLFLALLVPATLAGAAIARPPLSPSTP